MPIDVFWFMVIALAVHIGGWISIVMDKSTDYRDILDLDYYTIEQKIRDMHWRDFELFLGKLFEWNGHTAVVTPSEMDFGRDIIIDNEIFVEAKHYTTSVCGREVCQKLIGSCAMFGIHKAIIITTGEYHQNAYEYQEELNQRGEFYLELYSMYDIMNMIRRVKSLKSLEELKTIA